jgi:hypothetical protein
MISINVDDFCIIPFNVDVLGAPINTRSKISLRELGKIISNVTKKKGNEVDNEIILI